MNVYIFCCYKEDALVGSEEFLKSGDRRFQLLRQSGGLAELVDQLFHLLALESSLGAIEDSDSILQWHQVAHREVHFHD